MKALFLLFHGFDEASGITKKIRYQVKALKECGVDVRLCYYNITSDGHRQWKADNEVLADFGTGILAKLKKRVSYTSIVEYIHKENISFVYIRSFHNANPFTINLVKKIKEGTACKVVIEIPTFPYDQEYSTFRMKMDLVIDKCFRNKLSKQTDAIVTFSNEPTIFGQNTIRISNGIDFSAIEMKRKALRNIPELHLIGVAEIHYWHGFDRVIKGMVEYYKSDPEIKVYFHLVGDFTGERERSEILTPIRENRLEEYVILYGARHGKELDDLFDQADFAVGSLGRHRSGITHIKTLKNREYAARGIPFIYSETDDDFEAMPYILKAPADESPIDIAKVITFHQKLILSPQEIRESVNHLSWKSQMNCILQTLFHEAFTYPLVDNKQSANIRETE